MSPRREGRGRREGRRGGERRGRVIYEPRCAPGSRGSAGQEDAHKGAFRRPAPPSGVRERCQIGRARSRSQQGDRTSQPAAAAAVGRDSTNSENRPALPAYRRVRQCDGSRTASRRRRCRRRPGGAAGPSDAGRRHRLRLLSGEGGRPELRRRQIHGRVVRGGAVLADLRAERQVLQGPVRPQRHHRAGVRQKQHGGHVVQAGQVDRGLRRACGPHSQPAGGEAHRHVQSAGCRRAEGPVLGSGHGLHQLRPGILLQHPFQSLPNGVGLDPDQGGGRQRRRAAGHRKGHQQGEHQQEELPEDGAGLRGRRAAALRPGPRGPPPPLAVDLYLYDIYFNDETNNV